MNDMTILIIIGVVLLLIWYVSTRENTNYESQQEPNTRRDDNTRRGTGRPRYDDPRVRGSGGFGRNTSRVPTQRSNGGYSWMNDDDERRRRTEASPRARTDSERVDGRGGFGRDKD